VFTLPLGVHCLPITHDTRIGTWYERGKCNTYGDVVVSDLVGGHIPCDVDAVFVHVVDAQSGRGRRAGAPDRQRGRRVALKRTEHRHVVTRVRPTSTYCRHLRRLTHLSCHRLQPYAAQLRQSSVNYEGKIAKYPICCRWCLKKIAK